jgi:hypothetical protein
VEKSGVDHHEVQMQALNIPVTCADEMGLRWANEKLKKCYCKMCKLIPPAYQLYVQASLLQRGPAPRRTRWSAGSEACDEQVYKAILRTVGATEHQLLQLFWLISSCLLCSLDFFTLLKWWKCTAQFLLIFLAFVLLGIITYIPKESI